MSRLKVLTENLRSLLEKGRMQVHAGVTYEKMARAEFEKVLDQAVKAVPQKDRTEIKTSVESPYKVKVEFSGKDGGGWMTLGHVPIANELVVTIKYKSGDKSVDKSVKIRADFPISDLVGKVKAALD